jgi:cyclophilin family peptidyl-prolyl cis-trans isomerase
MTTTSRRLLILVVVILVLALFQWYLNSRPTSYFNQYGAEPATSTPATATSTDTAVSTPTSASPKPAGTISPNGDAITNKVTPNATAKNFMHTVTIETSKGNIVIETYDADAPNTVKNFLSLIDKNFYNGLIFHRTIPGFMIQGGDPTGTGMGGPGYKFADELDPTTDSYKTGYVRGTVAMANSGPNTNGSQFFIMHKDYALPHLYTIFGKVVSGMDVVDAIATAQTGAQDRPVNPIAMTKVTEVAK